MSKIELQGKKIAEIELHIGSSDVQINSGGVKTDKLQERITQLEVKTPLLDTRIAKLEEINLECSFPQSLKKLVSQNLQE